ncbi:MAG: FAD binding domain-containing protein [Rhodospirillales bacterium]
MGAYLRPASLDEAIAAAGQGGWMLLAGGTDFYPARVGKPVRENILDITGIEELRGISDRGDAWHIGAGATWSDLRKADLPACFDGLKAAAAEVGGVQIQNAATICGNICNASPAADGVPPLLALSARVELVDRGGIEDMPLSKFILGNRRTARRPDQIVTGIRIPRRPAASKSAFYKLGARRYLVISIVMAACTLDSDENDAITRARVVVGACSEVATRIAGLEEALIGRQIGSGLADLVDPSHVAGLKPIDDVRATAGYRTEAAAEALRRLFDKLEGRE